MRIAVRHLGLAAYVKIHGGVLTDVQGKDFIFESEKPLLEWRIAYNNSCCMKHDAAVCDLRVFLTERRS